jgi:hypothetical protein
MTGFVIFALFIFVFVLISRFSSSGTRSATQLANTSSGAGVHARGLVLSASQQSKGTRSGGLRYEQRQMTIEVEIPGEAPYVTTGYFLAPRGVVEAIPGSSLELMVDRSNPSNLVILGPGGFTGPWLRSGPPRAY